MRSARRQGLDGGGRERGLLLASGLIVGESLMGLLIAALIGFSGKDAPLALVGEGLPCHVAGPGPISWACVCSLSPGAAQMKTGRSDGEQAEYRQGNFGFAHEWLQEFKTLDEVLERLDELRAADPAHRYLCTLDDVSQCSYTSGHASQDERLYLDSPDDMDWEDPAQEQALTLASLQHRVAQLQRPELEQDWAQVCGTPLLAAEDVDALLQANRRPEVLVSLDEVVYVQRLPVPDDELHDCGAT